MSKKSYTKPELRELGSADQVTQADYKYGGNDGLYGDVNYSYPYKPVNRGPYEYTPE
jgi:hypothetical protein